MLPKSIPNSSVPAAAILVAALLLSWAEHAPAQNWTSTKIVGSGVAKTEARAVGGFHGVALGVDAKLEVHLGNDEGLTISGADNIVPLVETVVEDGTLKIRWSKGTHSTRYENLAIVVTARTIDALTVSGSGDIHAAQIKAGKVHATIGGSGQIVIDALDATALSASIAGSGDLTASGRTDSLDVHIAGSGDLNAGRLESRSARIAVSGSGDATVWARESLSASIAGSGDVRYFGTPQVKRTVVGSGKVMPAAARGS
jgi:hypothetical protein